MRDLRRNQRQVYYALCIGEKSEIDGDGYETGDVSPVYGDPVGLRCNISAAVGEDVARVFGSYTDYSRVICTSDTTCPITEGTIVWYGCPPDRPHNYRVVRRADSPNGLLFALSEVNVR